ncbi:MAG: DMT family transporter [Streptosporangiales bacterium]|nr:DMT family transporter [Streptosporangiales bacterium]MBO0890099.1 DMT family transporter [Acidothermales bacterium]
MTAHSALAIVLALIGAACYAVGAALQHQQAAATTPAGRLRPRLLLELARRPRWLAGIVANGAGAALHVTALSLAPLALVQPVGVMTIAFAVPAGALLRGRRQRGGELVGAGVVTAGLALLMTTIRAPHAAPALSFLDAEPVAGMLAALLGVATLVVRRMTGPARTIVLATAAGISFGVTSALMRPLAHAVAAGGIAAIASWLTLATLTVAAGGLLMEQSAYQTGRLGLAVAVVTVVDPIAAVVGGAVLLHQPAHLASRAVAVVAGAFVVAGVALLSRRFPHGFDHAAVRGLPAGSGGAHGLRILIGADTYLPHVNGAAYFTHRLAHGLAARGHEVHVCAPSADGDARVEMDGAVYVHRVRSMRAPFVRDFRVASPLYAGADVSHVIGDVRPDVVHVQNHFLVGRRLCRVAGRRGLPLVATNHFMPENLLPYLPLPTKVARLLTILAWHDVARVFRPATAITTPTPTAARLVAASGIGKRIEAVSCGIDLRRFRERPAASRTGGRKRILFVGRLDAEKHIEDVVDALPAIREKVDAEFVVAGKGNLREPLERRAAARGVAAHVRFLGFVPDADLPALYSSADVFCMPGTAELQSLVTLEAMATGRPVVAADAMALPHLCQHGRNGFLHEPRDVDELGRHVASILADDDLRRRMGAESLAIASGHEQSRTLQRFEEIYGEVTGYAVSHAHSPQQVAA